MATPPETLKSSPKAAKTKPASVSGAPRAPRKTASPKPAAPRAAPVAAQTEPKTAAVAKPPKASTAAPKPASVATAPKQRAKPDPKPKPKPAVAAKPKALQKSPRAMVTTVRQAVTSVVPPIDRKTAWSLGAAALAAGAGIAAFLTRGRIATLVARTKKEGHVPTDLLGSKRNADDRAIADFRPDMAAPMTAGEREALRPPGGAPR